MLCLLVTLYVISKPTKNSRLWGKLSDGARLMKNGDLGLQIRSGVAKAALGGFDSHTFNAKLCWPVFASFDKVQNLSI